MMASFIHLHFSIVLNTWRLLFLSLNNVDFSFMLAIEGRFDSGYEFLAVGHSRSEGGRDGEELFLNDSFGVMQWGEELWGLL